eukprot:364951-Chlamydomonas_euryale.AAC.2
MTWAGVEACVRVCMGEPAGRQCPCLDRPPMPPHLRLWVHVHGCHIRAPVRRGPRLQALLLCSQVDNLHVLRGGARKPGHRQPHEAQPAARRARRQKNLQGADVWRIGVRRDGHLTWHLGTRECGTIGVRQGRKVKGGCWPAGGTCEEWHNKQAGVACSRRRC